MRTFIVIVLAEVLSFSLSHLGEGLGSLPVEGVSFCYLDEFPTVSVSSFISSWTFQLECGFDVDLRAYAHWLHGC